MKMANDFFEIMWVILPRKKRSRKGMIPVIADVSEGVKQLTP